jgi:L-ribulose-5-phosphate 3-epimerase
MKNLFYSCALVLTLLSACNNRTPNQVAANDRRDGTVNWQFGVALWTFHTFNFEEALAKVDSAGLKFIEPNTFHKTGPQLKDSLILQLSMEGLDKLKSMISQKGLTCESIYIVGDSTIGSWKKQFDIAKRLGVRFVTTEPPLSLWDAIDSLAGVYNMKVAIHEHWRGTSHYWDPDTTLMAIKGHPNFGVCADLGHWPKSGINPLDAVKKLSGHIIAIHLKDIAAYNDPKLVDVPLGTGVVDFPALFRELKKQGFDGPVYIERDAVEQPSNLPSVRDATRYYQEQLAKLQ